MSLYRKLHHWLFSKEQFFFKERGLFCLSKLQLFPWIRLPFLALCHNGEIFSWTSTTKNWHWLISLKNNQESLPPLLKLSALFINFSSHFSSTGYFIREKKQCQASVILRKSRRLSWWWQNWWILKFGVDLTLLLF